MLLLLVEGPNKVSMELVFPKGSSTGVFPAADDDCGAVAVEGVKEGDTADTGTGLLVDTAAVGGAGTNGIVLGGRGEMVGEANVTGLPC